MLGAEGWFCPKLRKLFGAKGVRSWEGWDRLKWFFLKYRETELSKFVPRLGSSRSCSRSSSSSSKRSSSCSSKGSNKSRWHKGCTSHEVEKCRVLLRFEAEPYSCFHEMEGMFCRGSRSEDCSLFGVYIGDPLFV